MTSEIGYTYPAYINSLVCGLFVDDDKEHLHDPNVWTGTNARLKQRARVFYTEQNCGAGRYIRCLMSENK